MFKKHFKYKHQSISFLVDNLFSYYVLLKYEFLGTYIRANSISDNKKNTKDTTSAKNKLQKYNTPG